MTHTSKIRFTLSSFLVGLGLMAPPAFAASIHTITPSGQVSGVSQVAVTLKQAAVPLGQPEATPPVNVQCDGKPLAGAGRWLDEKQWVFEPNQPLEGGRLCSVTANTQFKDLDGHGLTMPAHSFHTGGPEIQNVRPDLWYSTIDENQYFLLELNSLVDPASLDGRAWCETKGVGERIPLRILPEADRLALIHATDADEEIPSIAVTCQRRFTPGVEMRLIWDKGIAAPNGLKTTERQTHEYTVREPFKADFSCEREQARSACIPVLPMRLRFNAGIALEQVPNIRLTAGSQQWQASVQLQDEWGYASGPILSLADLQKEPERYAGQSVQLLQFDGPLPENTSFTIDVPAGLKDESGRDLDNAKAFPLAVSTGPAPALAKFATGRFAVIERFAEGYHEPALLPVTVRKIEAPMPVKIFKVDSDAEIIEWMLLNQAASPDSWGIQRSVLEAKGVQNIPPRKDENGSIITADYVEARTISLLNHVAAAEQKQIPASPPGSHADSAEVIGIPLQAGFQVVEVESPKLGKELLDPQYVGNPSLYARTSVLVTNLAVHFKLGEENSLAWVTSLDSGRPVANAKVRINTCEGKLVAEASTNSDGIARFDQVAGAPPECRRADQLYWGNAYMVSARSADGADLGLVWTDWDRGIEPWRFNVATGSRYYRSNTIAHTVTDRSLLRAGETVHMKHYLRKTKLKGFESPSLEETPTNVVVRHVGSGREFEQALQWSETAGKAVVATSELRLPQSAPLGRYQIELKGAKNSSNEDRYYPSSFYTADFRVEEFRLPVMQGSVTPITASGNSALIAQDSVDMSVQLNYLSGGAAINWPVHISAIVEPRGLHFADYGEYTFNAPYASPNPDEEENNAVAAPSQRLLLDKKALQLDAQGMGKVTIQNLNGNGNAKGPTEPSNLRVEATFADPSGEMQTITRVEPLWQTDALVGIATDYWVSVQKQAPVRTVVLNTAGKPVSGVAVQVRAKAHTTLSTRKRMVGGFYKYEHHYETKDLGVVCQGKSDAGGRFACEAKLNEPGQLELIAEIADSQGRASVAATQIWVTQDAEMWFDGEASDRMDVLAEKTNYQPGEIARFQVRMPYRQAQALIAVEREGIVQTQVIELSGKDPSFTLKVDEAWAPNVYVSVLAVRGRLREVPWYSFFTWGFRSPRIWWSAWRNDTGEAVPPTAMVDLSKPSHRLGVAGIKVGHDGFRLNVKVNADKTQYQTRETAQLQIEATLPNGKPAANADVALAVVDQALLELSPNRSWNLLEAMMGTRVWDVTTSTAQMEVLGRRHYGRKAMPAGGGGGSGADGSTRELFDTLASWQPRIQLDAQGKATVAVPLNDSLTRFRAEAVADAGVQYFGSGSTELLVTQDLQVISGLPPVVREGDAYEARFTIRNNTNQAIQANVSARYIQTDLAATSVNIPAGGAQTVQWPVAAPVMKGDDPQESLTWEIHAQNQPANGNTDTTTLRDSIKIQQTLMPALPVTVRQASLRQLTEPLDIQVAMPDRALEGRGELRIDAQASLAGDVLPGLLRWWRWYPYACLEQRYSKSVGMMDLDLFHQVQEDLPSYLDSNGLANYFPAQGSRTNGNVYLTAHILNIDATLGALGESAMRIDEQSRNTMIRALEDYAEGRLKINEPELPIQNRSVSRLFALAALSGHQAISASMLESLEIAPQRLPTHAVLDWLQILKASPQLPNRNQRLEQAQHELRSRMVLTGTQVLFTTERNDNWWWMMQNGNTNAARLLLLTADMPEWKSDMGALASGLMGRQQDGHWGTTTANIWGQLAVRRFAQLHESELVTGELTAQLGAETRGLTWPEQAAASGNTQSKAINTSTESLRTALPWPDAIARLGDPEGALRLRIAQIGTGRPWITLTSLAAVPLTEPVSSGIRLEKTITPVQQAVAGQWSQGDIYRVNLVMHANANIGMTALTDPIPTGSTILGSGLGRDSAIATSGEADTPNTWGVAWVERKMDVMRVYYYHLRQGETRYTYTVRINQPGQFDLPPTRAEALYMPQVFGEWPNASVHIADLPTSASASTSAASTTETAPATSTVQ